MKKSAIVFCLVLLTLTTVSHAFGGPAPKSDVATGPVVVSGRLLIDDFESGSLRSPREWWTFDLKTAAVEENASLTGGDQAVSAQKGKYSLHLKGSAKSWYAGGVGTYLARENVDLSKYNAIRLDIYGNGEGTVRLELYDDDNLNWQVEQDPAKGYAATHDDKFIYDIIVDWQGWKRVVVPFDDFVDDNPGVGDDVWNIEQRDGSGGLLQLQVICLASSEKGNVDFLLDNIFLTESEQ